jgi:hypothetical protein
MGRSYQHVTQLGSKSYSGCLQLSGFGSHSCDSSMPNELSQCSPGDTPYRPSNLERALPTTLNFKKAPEKSCSSLQVPYQPSNSQARHYSPSLQHLFTQFSSIASLRLCASPPAASKMVAATNGLEQEDHRRDAEFNKALHGKSAQARGGIAAMFAKSKDAKQLAVEEYFKHFDHKSAEAETKEDREVC